MDAGLGRERAFAHVGRVTVRSLVQDLIQNAARMRELGETLRRDAGLEHVREGALEQQRRDDRGQIGVAATLADAVQRALDLSAALPHRG